MANSPPSNSQQEDGLSVTVTTVSGHSYQHKIPVEGTQPQKLTNAVRFSRNMWANIKKQSGAFALPYPITYYRTEHVTNIKIRAYGSDPWLKVFQQESRKEPEAMGFLKD